jgi:serine/threonine-protein kinase
MQRNDQQMIGQMLGPYRLEAVLGHGGMGVVYLARQTRPARYVAVKVLQFQPEMGDRSIVLARFQREANTAAMLEHIHIIPIFDYGELAQIAYLVMPYVNGGSLSDVLQRQGKLPLAQALDYLQQAASALDYAHAHSVIHRDLKPSNFLLYPDGRLVLADFGIARVLEGAESSSYITLSTPNSTLGTPSYMSPEMAYGMPVDTRTDIYALGIVFFQMLSGHVPFQGPDALSVLYMHANTPLPSLYALDPTLPASIDTILQKATAKRSEERYASAGEMVKDLQSMLQRGDVAFMPQTPYASDVAATYVHDPSQQQGAASSYSQMHQQSTAVSAGATLKERKNRPLNTLLKVLPLIVLIITVIVVGLRVGGVFAFPFPQNTPSTAATPTNTPTPSSIDLAKQVVTQYYDDINQQDYWAAYNLLAPDFQHSLSYSTFAQGYSATIHDTVTFNSVSQNGDGSVSVSTTLNTHENTNSGPTYNTFQWNAKLIQVNGAWRIESAQQWKK